MITLREFIEYITETFTATTLINDKQKMLFVVNKIKHGGAKVFDIANKEISLKAPETLPDEKVIEVITNAAKFKDGLNLKLNVPTEVNGVTATCLALSKY